MVQLMYIQTEDDDIVATVRIEKQEKSIAMQVQIASMLLPVRRRADWEQPHLSYMPKTCYMRPKVGMSGTVTRMLRRMLARRA